MKKTITIISIIGALLLILDSANAGHGLMLWVFAGIIPGTNILVSPVGVMAIYVVAITLVILRLTIWQQMQVLFSPRITPANPTKKHSTRRRTA